MFDHAAHTDFDPGYGNGGVVDFYNNQASSLFRNAPTQNNEPKNIAVARQINEKSQRQEYGRQYGVFSGSASIKFYCTQDKNGNPTISIQAANKEGSSFDWANKTNIQFLQKELPEFLAALYGVLPVEEVAFDNHGDANNKKSFKVKHQPQSGGFYLSVIEKGKKIKGVPIGYNDAMIIASMVLAQLTKTMELDVSQVMKMINHFIIKMKYGVGAAS